MHANSLKFSDTKDNPILLPAIFPDMDMETSSFKLKLISMSALTMFSFVLIGSADFELHINF